MTTTSTGQVHTRAHRPAPWRALLVAMLAGSLVLTVVSFALPHVFSTPGFTEETGSWRLLLDVVHDHNIPSWWSSTLLAVAAATYVVAAWSTWPESRARGTAWLLLGAIMGMMSLDDSVRVHERLDILTNQVLDPGEWPFTWLLLGVPIALAVIVVAVVLARALPRSSRTAVLVGLGLFLAAAVGLEAIGGVLLRDQGVNMAYRIMYHVEELIEMVGAAVLAVAALMDMVIGQRVRSARTGEPAASDAATTAS